MSIREQRVEFEVGGETVVGVLFRPEESGAGRSERALVVLGPLTSVKEQVPSNYGQAMARRGYVALAIDNRHFGESGGQPRQYEYPPRKVEDVRAAIRFLREQVRVTAIGAVGVCAGAGYMSGVVAGQSPVQAFAAVAGFFHDVEQQREWMGDGFATSVEQARAARQRYEQGGECEYIPAVGKEGDVAMPLDEAFEYYGTPRGAVPAYTNRFAIMSREHTVPWDAQSLAPTIEVPTLLVHSEHALAPSLARKFYRGLGGRKRELWLESKGQIDFYDDPALIEPVADALAEHFDRALGAAT